MLVLFRLMAPAHGGVLELLDAPPLESAARSLPSAQRAALLAEAEQRAIDQTFKDIGLDGHRQDAFFRYTPRSSSWQRPSGRTRAACSAIASRSDGEDWLRAYATACSVR